MKKAAPTTAPADYMQTLHLALLYVGTACLGFCQGQGSSLLVLILLLFYLGSVAVTWAVLDAQARGLFLPQGWRIIFWAFWMYLMPVYLLWSRGIGGIGICLVHVVGLMVSWTLGNLLAASLYF